MLALQQAEEVRISIRDYLTATFGFRDPQATIAFEKLLDDQEAGIFKGPYISIQLPYRKASENQPIPLEIAPGFTPYLHQLKAFQKLSSRDGKNPQPAIVTTGTASGKTEAFLYPLLDFCYKHRMKKGIKAIIMYPMNALATDQSRRLAEAIHEDPRLRGNITAGLFIGESSRKEGDRRSQTMLPDRIIEDRDSILSAPPDILMTNFKMLDFSLLQSRYHNLWHNNLNDPQLLQFLVIDELHTFDGVKGTDVANLIRRIKLKLAIPEGHLCPIGTSATLGTGEEAKEELADFASRIFGEMIGEDAIIDEERLAVQDFFRDAGAISYLPDLTHLSSARLKKQESYPKYLREQRQVWRLDPDMDPVSLGHSLKNISVVRHLLECLSGAPIHFDDLILQLNRKNRDFSELPDYDEELDLHPKKEMLRSLLALITDAKSKQGNHLIPFLYVQTKLWIRELSPFIRPVSEQAAFFLRDQMTARHPEEHYLPTWFCRDCGGSGWVAAFKRNQISLIGSYEEIIQKYFGAHQDLCLILPDTPENQPAEEYQATFAKKVFLDPQELVLKQDDEDGGIPVWVLQKHRNQAGQQARADLACPNCNTRNTLNIIGVRNSTLVSVAVSQILSSDLDERNDLDRKLLGFTDSVQDAAHRAGFIQARNYRFSFRSALQTVINRESDPVSLSRLILSFQEYWIEHADELQPGNLKTYYYRFFPEDKEREIEPDSITNDKKELESHIPMLNDRIGWEISTEFGYNAIIGRSLEKSGSATAWVPVTTLNEVYEEMQPWLESNTLGHIEKEEFVRFLTVFLYRVRTRGGVDHPIMNLYRTQKPSYYLLGPNANREFPYARHFGKRTRLPRLLTTRSNKFEIYDRSYRGAQSPANWFHHYFIKSFQLASSNYALINELFDQLSQVLSAKKFELFSEKDAAGLPNFCINPDKLMVTGDCGMLECNACGHRISVHEDESELISGAACHQFNCTGSYRPKKLQEQESYYQEVYNRQRHPKIYTHEHTGLLDRDIRENVENRFKVRSEINDPNVLIATSTLEMGINIGDLDTTVNIDIPPGTAQYKQRIGRAGRKSGSALIVNFSGREDHDLFYFEEPLEMMAGEISTPACYLESFEILKRHFYAYCFDTWAKQDPDKNTIPSTLRDVKLEHIDLQKDDYFLTRYVSFSRSQLDSLYHAFEERYPELTVDVFDQLYKYLHSLSFETVLFHAFENARARLEELKKRQKDIDEYIREKTLHPDDPEYKDLIGAKKDLQASRKHILSTQTLEFLTNEGILPNYGFPESGIRMNASIYKPEAQESDVLEAVRPASSGLRELAPDQHFYFMKYRLPITGIEVQNQEQDIITYRFCSNCDHLLEDSLTDSTHCPKCGHGSWGSAGNTHSILDFRSAQSSSLRRDVITDDAKDQREETLLSITRHFQFSRDGREGSHVLEKIPFGIEYDSRTTLTEINTGPRANFSDDVHQKCINEEHVSDTGYVYCKSCGRSTAKLEKWDVQQNQARPKDAKDYHYPYCRNKHITWQGNGSEMVFHPLYLKRKLSTESLRILLPVQDVEAKERVEMFKAGLQIGLRKYFKGEPSHLRMDLYKETNKTTGKKDLFLMIYDSIPGGSGYVNKLFNPVVFSKILTGALEVLRSCDCQNKAKQGCYKCVYNYQNRFRRSGLTREGTEELFEEICESLSEWKFQEGSLSDTTITGGIEESELEIKFIRLLQTIALEDKTPPGTDAISVDVRKTQGRRYYVLNITRGTHTIEYEILPQQELGPRQGVAYVTVPDFLFYPVGVNKNGELDKNALRELVPVAVYLDGYQYHASEQHNMFPRDVLKRSGIVTSGRYITWTLTWKDLERYDSERPDKDGLALLLNDQAANGLAQRFSRHPLLRESEDHFSKLNNSVERLLFVLALGPHPDSIKTDLQKSLYKLQSLNDGTLVDRTDLTKYLDFVISKDSAPKTDDHNNAWMILNRIEMSGSVSFRAGVSVTNLNTLASWKIDDSATAFDMEEWEAYWHRFNILQFYADNVGNTVRPPGSPDEETVEPDSVTDVTEGAILEHFDESLHDTVKWLLRRGEKFNTSDYFYLSDEIGDSTAVADLGLPEHRIVVNPFDKICAVEFQEAGYRILKAEQLKEELE